MCAFVCVRARSILYYTPTHLPTYLPAYLPGIGTVSADNVLGSGLDWTGLDWSVEGVFVTGLGLELGAVFVFVFVFGSGIV